MTMTDKILFLAWERHRRFVTLSSKLGGKAIFFESSQCRIVKYLIFFIKTILVLVAQKPRILVVQNPSLVLVCIAIFLKPLFRYCLVVDAHNIGVLWYGNGSLLFNYVLNLIHRFSDITIVTNDSLAGIVKKNGGRPVILPDPIPEFEKTVNAPSLETGSDFNVTFICTFASDEPYMSVFEAASLLQIHNVKIFVTGDVKKIRDVQAFHDKINLIFMGYVSDEEYWELLSRSHCIIDLTTRDNCLVCGAYEGTSLGVPLVLSDTKVTRDLFNRGVVYTNMDALSIAEAILEVKENYKFLTYEIQDLRSELKLSWDFKRDNLLRVIRERLSGNG